MVIQWVMGFTHNDNSCTTVTCENILIWVYSDIDALILNFDSNFLLYIYPGWAAESRSWIMALLSFTV